MSPYVYLSLFNSTKFKQDNIYGKHVFNTVVLNTARTQFYVPHHDC
jgi:hypothetical protein